MYPLKYHRTIYMTLNMKHRNPKIHAINYKGRYERINTKYNTTSRNIYIKNSQDYTLLNSDSFQFSSVEKPK